MIQVIFSLVLKFRFFNAVVHRCSFIVARIFLLASGLSRSLCLGSIILVHEFYLLMRLGG